VAPKVSTEPSALQVKPGGGVTPLEAAAQAGVKAVGKGMEATKEERSETATRRQRLDEITNRVSGGRYKTYMSAPAELQARVIREEQGG
jgi:predicted NUDIX family NTP pyrophosphohydrolase